jgi:hypothetical protein
MGYYDIGIQDWPVSSVPVDSRAASLPTEEVLDALNGLDAYLEPARKSLKQTAAEGLRELDQNT